MSHETVPVIGEVKIKIGSTVHTLMVYEKEDGKRSAFGIQDEDGLWHHIPMPKFMSENPEIRKVVVETLEELKVPLECITKLEAKKQ